MKSVVLAICQTGRIMSIRASGGALAGFLSIFFMCFPSPFDRQFCIFVQEWLRLRLRLKGAVKMLFTIFSGRKYTINPHKPTFDFKSPQSLNLTLSYAQNSAFWGKNFPYRFFQKLLEYFCCAVRKPADTFPIAH